MSDFGPYITNILRGTYLSKREKRAWREEMLCHLEEASASAMQAGMTADQANAYVLASFGRVSEVRQRIVRETYGVSPRWFVVATVVSVVMLVLTMFVNMRVNDVIPATATPFATPGWVLVFHNHLPSSPAVWAGVAIVCFMLLYTRKRKDRLAVCVAISPFLIAWFMERIIGQGIPFREMFISTSTFYMISPFGVPEMAGYILILGLCIAIYGWTSNRIVGITPWAITIALTLVPIIWDTIQAGLWHVTNNPIFWGARYPGSYFIGWVILVMLARVVTLALYLYGCRKIDEIRLRKSTAA